MYLYKYIYTYIHVHVYTYDLYIIIDDSGGLISKNGCHGRPLKNGLAGSIDGKPMIVPWKHRGFLAFSVKSNQSVIDEFGEFSSENWLFATKMGRPHY